jgi:hypothetical protein
MPATESLGKNRTDALYQAGAFLIWLFVLSWTTLTVGFTIAIVWASLNFIWKIVLDEELTWGRAWAESTLRWNYQFLYYSLGMEDFPGWMSWMPN